MTTLFDGSSSDAFFDGFTFESEADPARSAIVKPYTDFVGNRSAAQAAGLVTPPAGAPLRRRTEASGSVYIGVDHTARWAHTRPTDPVEGRKSVRLFSNEAFGEGLFVLDFTHIPQGCGTWPSWRFMKAFDAGDTYDQEYGIREIDVIEMSNLIQTNQGTLHTSDDCTMETSCQDRFSGTWANPCECAGKFDGEAPCDKHQEPSFECGVYQTEANRGSFAEALNAADGGHYVMERTGEHIKMWFFPRGSAPPELINAAGVHGGEMSDLAPSHWGMPFAEFPLGTLCPSSVVSFTPPRSACACSLHPVATAYRI